MPTYTVQTPAYTVTVPGDSEAGALDSYAREVGYVDFADLAATLEKSEADARAELTVIAYDEPLPGDHPSGLGYLSAADFE